MLRGFGFQVEARVSDFLKRVIAFFVLQLCPGCTDFCSLGSGLER